MNRAALVTLLMLLSLPWLAARAADAKSSPDSIKLRPGDSLFYRVAEDPSGGEGYEKVVVNSASQIRLVVSRGYPELIKIGVENKTLGEIKAELKEALDKDYYKDATVELEPDHIQGPKKGTVIFIGEVRKSSLEIDTENPPTLFVALMTDVGVQEFANLKRVKIDRIDPKTQKREEIFVDVEAIKKGKREKDVPLQDGDRVTVREKGLIFN